jgi:hypothetical protein
MDTLKDGQRLNAGEKISSLDGNFYLIMQADNNLVLYDKNNKPYWATNTVGSNATFATMQSDGNLVLYTQAGQPVWASHTDGHPNAYLIIQNDRNLVIYQNGNNAIWASNTYQAPTNQSSGNFTVAPDGNSLIWNGNIDFPDNGGSIAMGGNFKIVLASNGDYSFIGHMHDSGFVGYKYSVAMAIAISSGITYTFSQSGSVEGTVNALPFGSPNRDSDWNQSKNNPSVKEKWEDIVRTGQFVSKSTTHDTFTSGVSDLVQSAAADAAKTLISKGIQAGIMALIALA